MIDPIDLDKWEKDADLSPFFDDMNIRDARAIELQKERILLLIREVRRLKEQKKIAMEALELCINCENGYPERLTFHSKEARRALCALGEEKK